MTSKRAVLRERLKGDGALVAPGVYDCVSAKVAEHCGAQAVIVTGAGLAASMLGQPDLGLLTMTEVASQTRHIVRSTSIPVIADCDTGYGAPLNVRRTIQEFEDAGVAAVFLEDQVAPKRCGHFTGKLVVPVSEMVLRIRAAIEARTDADLVVIARTDALATHGLNDALGRARRYVEAGADAIFVEAPRSREELEVVGSELAPLGVPLMVNLVEGGRTPLLPVHELADMGFQLITFSGSMQKTAIRAMQDLVASLLTTGEVTDFFPERMVSLDERSDLLGLPHYVELEERYSMETAMDS